MSDSFGDLWASSNPVKSQSQSLRTLASTTTASTSRATRRATPDAFTILASASSSRLNSRPNTPAMKPQPATSSTGDAFGGLVSFGGASESRDGSLTIAERAAKAERERREQIEKNNAALNSQGSFWDQYDVSVSSPNKRPSLTVPIKSTGGWDFDFLTPDNGPSTSKPPKLSSSIHNDDTWDLEVTTAEFIAASSSQHARQTTDIFDLDQLSDLARSSSTEPSRANTPGSFDFGDREDQLVRSEEMGKDLLGTLAIPVDAVRRVSSQPISDENFKTTSNPLLSHKQSASPPPHVLGRIVEMGFSVQQAKVALGSTSTGVDIDVALEILLRGGISTPHREQASPSPEFKPRRAGPSRSDMFLATSEPSSSRPDIPPAQHGLQADKLMAQASSIGLNMFSKANALWREGKEKVAKVYEEQRLGKTATDGSKGQSLPRWMGEARMMDDNDSPSTEKSVYISPARRRPPVVTASAEDILPPIIPAITPPASIQTPLPPFSRPTIETLPSALSSSNTHKAAGTEHFKLGRFAEADSSYSLAIDSLPASHLLRVPLHNNRALARIKTGEYKRSIQDTTEVLRIVTGDLGTTWHPGREVVQTDINLGEAVSKALRRRAEANEGLERWKEAGIDWERLNATPWANQALKMDAVKGIGRCRGMASRQETTTRSSFEVEPKWIAITKSKPVQVSSHAPTEALLRVRAANIAQEKEDQDRHDLKDVVDARLELWRTGKEANIRALIASLDTVLPPTFEWQKVSMAELISPKQVKLRYTKAIARLHPDKLNTDNTTLEERMIANGVFGALSEAWNATRE